MKYYTKHTNLTTNKTMVMCRPIFTNKKKAMEWAEEFMKAQKNSIVEVIREDEK